MIVSFIGIKWDAWLISLAESKFCVDLINKRMNKKKIAIVVRMEKVRFDSVIKSFARILNIFIFFFLPSRPLASKTSWNNAKHLFQRRHPRGAPWDLNLLQTYGSARAVCCRFKITQESAETVSP